MKQNQNSTNWRIIELIMRRKKSYKWGKKFSTNERGEGGY